MTKEALKLALEALETLHDENMDYLTRNKLGGENNQCMVFARDAITAIKEALAQPEQLRKENERLHVENRRLIDRIETIGVLVGVGGFATTPPQRTWVGLTDEEVKQLCLAVGTEPIEVRLIEAKLKEKST